MELPCFCPVATQASVKSLDSLELKELGAQMILANAYHLHLRPGEDLIKKQGRLHSFMSWPGPILTDSGGYQVFSLSKIRKINDEGVLFQNHLDGGELFITPEASIGIQMDLGSDIIMAFDHCPEGQALKAAALEASERTFDWLKRSKRAWASLSKSGSDEPPLLFGIVQGGMYEDLRQMSLEQVESLELPGVAVGGLSVGESSEKKLSILKFLSQKLPQDKVHYLMGVGSPQDLIQAIDLGFDLFDCVLPTRTARTGRFWTSDGFINIRNEKYKDDTRVISEGCGCLCCRGGYKRSYLRHLFLSSELLVYRLASLHNLHFYMELMQKARAAIEAKTWASFRQKTLHRMRDH